MQSEAVSTRSAFAEATRRDDGLESRPPDDHARTHGLVYRGPGRRAWEERPQPVVQEPTDAIVRITTSTICGTDLHILKGDVPSVTEGRILGHEGVGVVTEVGAGCRHFHSGDRVLISCITSCGRCDFCRKADVLALSTRRAGSSGTPSTAPRRTTCVFPTRIRVSTRSRQTQTQRRSSMLSDILPTGFECGVLNGRVQPGRHRRHRRRRPGRSGRAADGPVLFAGQHRDDRPRRQAAGGRQAIRRDDADQQH